MQDQANKPAGVRQVTVLGAGAWGTAVAMALAQRHDVLLWGRNQAAMDDMAQARINQHYLPGQPFPAGLKVSADFDAALATWPVRTAC